VLQALRLAGAAKIIAVDTMASKRDLALQFGATHFIDSSQVDAVDAVRQLTPLSADKVEGSFRSGGVDFSFECVGHPAVVRSAFEVLDWGGTCVVIGVGKPGSEVSLPVQLLNYVERTVTGCRYGSARPHHDFPMIVDHYIAGRLLLDELVSATHPLEEFEAIVADMHEGRLARGVLTL